MSKLRKLLRDPNLYFYDFFRKRLDGVDEKSPGPGKQVAKPSRELVAGRNIKDRANETRLFGQAVDRLISDGKPVKIHCGFRHLPKEGWINLDKWLHDSSRDFLARHPEEVFVFPFADESWPIPDNSVDYVFHEDFIEHIPQKLQVLFLAETRRVLRPGAWHRVNTPNLVWSMQQHSDFEQGARGVYQGEWDRWGHRALFTHRSLEEMATLIGYREVVFNGKNESVSEYRTTETRPKDDRADDGGNIFADLRK